MSRLCTLYSARGLSGRLLPPDIQSHASPLGVALLANAPERVVERRRRPRDSPVLSNSGVRATSRAAKQRSGLPPPEEQLASQRVSLRRGAPASPGGHGSPVSPTTQDRLSQVLRELEDESTPIVKLGDASIAAPFTSKLSSIQCSESHPQPLPRAHPRPILIGTHAHTFLPHPPQSAM